MDQTAVDRHPDQPVQDHESDQSEGKEIPADALRPKDSHGEGHQGTVSRLERWLLRKTLSYVGNPPLTVVLWNGEQISSAGPPIARVLIRDRRTLWRTLVDPMFQFAEGYSAGTLEIDGGLLELVENLDRSVRRAGAFGKGLWRWLRRPYRNTFSGSQSNIHHHYDIGDEFYKLWLDEQMVYTCAYFADPSFTLEQAQTAKMDHVCRKLQLQPGETVIEAGCGWGALALHMALHHGVTVKAYNISHRQIEYARRWSHELDLQDRVEFIQDDWRNITGRCDAFISVGMLEHVGRKNYRQLGDVIDGCLEAEGRGLIHSIGRNKPQPFDAWTERRIFPGAFPPTLSQMMDVFEPHSFSVLDVENLRLHYAETLKNWLERYERSVNVVREMFDEKFVRMWRLYLAGSVATFQTGGLQLFQITFARETNNAIPWTRAHQYPTSLHDPAGWLGQSGSGAPVFGQLRAAASGASRTQPQPTLRGIGGVTDGPL